ncbi:putative phosphatidate cytidylyltransferase [Aspergillus clavatus NRRL 1]|uniref:dolichol kinase n=1 Tax=Aspergillus clavatus (strain ATCC 1007 / CBS 513.65 / DSM 816 / NCTC 3887 / NRRL 1 / QM 1276 / 107) TaxID=344612 RepID=A1CHL7_ASPCL|nr:phosphatidate cytidylyltransferase, putative [Aspergillus clavatus NRRL 1]EAW10372.1 phosphatidate cytidylyltransferase, putative [Aspergillus clavatus NRRL 1]
MASLLREEEEAFVSSRDTSDLAIPTANPLRHLSRSPHPYRRKGLHCADSPSLSGDHSDRPTQNPSQWPKTSSDSGTEADDESTGILKGLPAPPVRLRKGLRSTWNGIDDNDLWSPILQPWPSFARSTSQSSRRGSGEGLEVGIHCLRDQNRQKRRIEVLRRLSEAALLLSVGGTVLWQESARSLAWAWKKELLTHALLVASLYAAYPLHQTRRLRLSRLSSFAIPTTFEPASLLYPVLIPIFVSLSISHHTPTLILPNILLSLSSLPAPVVPLHGSVHGHSISHWMITLIPILASEQWSADGTTPTPLSFRGLNSELLTLVFPLHQALIPTLDFLLTSSVLPAELHLLTTALINLFLFATSPQAEILKALLWLGGLCVFASCRHVLRWEVALARIPTWKFRRSPKSSRSPKNMLNLIDHKLCQKLSRTTSSEEVISDSDYPRGHLLKPRKPMHTTRTKTALKGLDSATADNVSTEEVFERHITVTHRRRHTISTFTEVVHKERIRTTPSGRRKRSMAPGLSSFLSLTVPQAQVRKWLYAFYVYIAVSVVILGPIRKYVSERALQGNEPFGWALGYLLGNVSWFRFWVLMWNLDHWIPLPARLDEEDLNAFCSLGWVEHLRQGTFGEANTRLMIAAYCAMVLLTGLAIVFQLSTVAEVDTRRKVFHGMMVLMFLPTVYIDPAFCALALAIVLSVFLLLDLFRASQLPPISRPLTYFLAPYVDGRDHRGPVIISHIFLLIGCSIPLWLSLADIPRTGSSPWATWDVASRDISMVSGVICVGMGDAAASLIGRRFGRRKWFWGGGKSLEGSLAFAIAVFCGLMVARIWLAVGQWPTIGSDASDSLFWSVTVLKAIIAASATSATEAILTGCNDNVVVPIILWLLVRGLGL